MPRRPRSPVAEAAEGGAVTRLGNSHDRVEKSVSPESSFVLARDLLRPSIDMTRDPRDPTPQCGSGSSSLSRRSVDDILVSEPDCFRLRLAVEFDPVAVLRLALETRGFEEPDEEYPW